MLVDGELLALKDELDFRRMLIEFIYTLHAFAINMAHGMYANDTIRHPLSTSTKFLKKIY